MAASPKKPPNQLLPGAITLVRQLRLQRGWSQDTLGQKVDWNGKPVSRQTIDKWEKDQQGLNLAKLAAVAKAFDLTLRDLLPKGFGDDDAPPDPLLPLSPEERRMIEWSRKGPRERAMAMMMSNQINDRQAELFVHKPAADKRG